MTIQISVSNRQKMGYLVEMLKSMDFVDTIQVQEEPLPDQSEHTEVLSVANTYWGAWKKNPLSLEKIDYEIRKMREEWDRDIY